jgi:hypothetical protein
MLMRSCDYRGHRLALLITAPILLLAGVVSGETYYIATDGSDDNSGAIDSPFATFEHAIDIATAGDTIYVRGGTYVLDGSIEIDTSGTSDDPINLWAYADESPILDFIDNPRHANPPQPRDDDSIAGTADALGLFMAPGSDWWHIRGLTIRNVPYYGVRVYSSYNVFEQLVIHDCKAAGLELTGKEGWSPSHNLIVDCDSFHNFDPQTNGEDADGFAAKFDTLGPGNVFRGLRAWNNSDDGYDFWHAPHPVLIEHCWSFNNGFFRPEWEEQVEGNWRGDGLGFKLGQDAAELVLNHVAAFGNKAFGIHDNGNGSPDGVTINNATLVNNAKDGNPVQIRLTDGRPHTVRNCIAFDVDGPGVTVLSAAVDDAYNTWNGIGVSEADFVNLDMETLLVDAAAPRDVEGGLPAIGLHLEPSSHLIDAGIDVGLPYTGDAPDLGAFETQADEPCSADTNDDGVVDVSDLLAMLGAWGPCAPSCPEDLDGSGDVSVDDLLVLLAAWGPCGRSSEQHVPPRPRADHSEIVWTDE